MDQFWVKLSNYMFSSTAMTQCFEFDTALSSFLWGTRGSTSEKCENCEFTVASSFPFTSQLYVLLCRVSGKASLEPVGGLCLCEKEQVLLSVMYVKHIRLQPYTHYVTYTYSLNWYSFHLLRVKGRDGRRSVMSSLSGFFFPPLVFSHFLPRCVQFLYACLKSWFRQRSCCYCWGLDFRLMSPLHWDVRSSLPENTVYCWRHTQWMY